MTYFKKAGRLTDEEKAIINSIEKTISEKNIPLGDIPECKTLDDLVEVQLLLDSYKKPEKFVEEIKNDSDDEPIKTEMIDEPDDSVNEPIQKEEIIEDVEILNESMEQTESESSEDILNDDEPEFVSNNYDPFEDEIIERSYNVNKENSEEELDESSTLSEASDVVLEESSGTPVDDLNPNTRKKVAEQSADAILKGYAKIIPQPFKWLAKIDEQKVEKLALDGQIDITIEVSETGMTFDEFMKQSNEQVDEVFEVDTDTLDEIREPLVEVLMEQELELTPQQRLAMAVVSHIAQMLMTALKLRKQNNRILEFQKKLTQMGEIKVAS